MSNTTSLLEELEAISERQGDGGLIHGGHIHFIQSRLGDEGGSGFVLKAGIYGVLERVPSSIPADLPEQVERDDFRPSDSLIKAINEVNEGLIMPMEGYDVVQTILAAREYIEAAKTTAGTAA